MPAATDPEPASSHAGSAPREVAPNLALTLAGGGARGAYQAGVIRGLARHLPQLRFPILTGVSAGGINATFLASHPGPLGESGPELEQLWARLHLDDVFRIDPPSLVSNFARWVARLASGGAPLTPSLRGLVDTKPLHDLVAHAVPTVDGEIVGIARNLERGRLRALALTTLNYSTGQTITWVQGSHFTPWRRPRRKGIATRFTVAHVMASAALPLFFPAVRLGDAWHGDGGVRLDAPLSPALHLGADRILAVSPRYELSEAEADRPKVTGYPPPAQILSQLMGAIFLDVLDRDVRNLELVNRLITQLPLEERGALRPIDILVIRPSEDLGRLAAEYEPQLPKAFRYLTRSLGTKETKAPDSLSIVMFLPEYLERLLAIGERDVVARLPEIRRLVGMEGEALQYSTLASDKRQEGRP
ncbi:MAG TPA: patatin-like phospholipase family protein [Thermoanaerobaculia bacterium]